MLTKEEEFELVQNWTAMWQAYDRQPTDAAMRLIVAAVRPYELPDLLEAIPRALRRYEQMPSVAQVLSCLHTLRTEVKLTALTLLVLRLNSLIDSGKFDDITVAEVHKWAEERNILVSLVERTKGEFSSEDYNEDGPYANFSNFYDDQMESLANVTVGSDFGIENSGLCLLVSWTNELIRQGSG